MGKKTVILLALVTVVVGVPVYLATRLTSPGTIVGRGEEGDVRKAAVQKLTDQTLLAKIAMEGEYLLRDIAAEKVTDQAMLAKIVMVKNKNPTAILRAAERITDKTLLAKVGMWIKPELTRQVTDQALLAEVVIQSGDPDVRAAAAEKLTDRVILARVAIEDWNVRACEAAVGRLTDQALLGKVALESRHHGIRATAVGKLSDQVVLGKVAVESNDPEIHAACVGRLYDQNALARVALGDKDPIVRRAAARKISDKALLAKIAVDNKDVYGYQAALAKQVLENPHIGDPKVRESAIDALTEPNALAMVAFRSIDSNCRWAAYCKLSSDPRLSAELAATAGEPVERACASVFSMMARGIQSIPGEHRWRRCRRFLDIVAPLMTPQNTEELGWIEDIQMSWMPTSQHYKPEGPVKRPQGSYCLEGETVTLSVKLSKRAQVHSHCWTSKFPLAVGEEKIGSFMPAPE